jgi:hypothetical protein
MINGVVMDTEEGMPQGGPLNPLLRKLASRFKMIPMEQGIE